MRKKVVEERKLRKVLEDKRKRETGIEKGKLRESERVAQRERE